MNVRAATNVAQFDIWDLDIFKAWNATDGTEFAFDIAQPNPLIGSVLQVNLGREVQVGEQVDIGIQYTTSPTG